MKKIDIEKITAEVKGEIERKEEEERKEQERYLRDISETAQSKEAAKLQKEKDIQNSRQYREIVEAVNNPVWIDLLQRVYSSEERFDKFVEVSYSFLSGKRKTKTTRFPHSFRFSKEGPTINEKKPVNSSYSVSGENSVTATVYCTLGQAITVKGSKKITPPKKLSVQIRWDLDPETNVQYIVQYGTYERMEYYDSSPTTYSSYEECATLEEAARFLIKLAITSRAEGYR